MDMQTSHLAAALMSGTTTHSGSNLQEANVVNEQPEKSIETTKETPEEEKEEMASGGEDFSDEVFLFYAILV